MTNELVSMLISNLCCSVMLWICASSTHRISSIESLSRSFSKPQMAAVNHTKQSTFTRCNSTASYFHQIKVALHIVRQGLNRLHELLQLQQVSQSRTDFHAPKPSYLEKCASLVYRFHYTPKLLFYSQRNSAFPIAIKQEDTVTPYGPFQNGAPASNKSISDDGLREVGAVRRIGGGAEH